MTKAQAKQVEAEMVAAGWTGVLLIARSTPTARGWEAVGSEPGTWQSMRMRSVEAWQQWKAKQQEAQP